VRRQIDCSNERQKGGGGGVCGGASLCGLRNTLSSHDGTKKRSPELAPAVDPTTAAVALQLR